MFRRIAAGIAVTYDLKKLKRSLPRLIRRRLEELLPDATIEPEDRWGSVLRIRQGDLEGTIRVDAVAEACHRVDRSSWGPIAGSFCNLVVSRVEAHSAPPLEGHAALDRIFPAVQPDDAEEDRLVREATPTDDLLPVGLPWLEGIRIEFDYVDPTAGRRLFARDLKTLGIDVDGLLERALRNMEREVPGIELKSWSAAPGVYIARGEGIAPAMLRAPAGHRSMLTRVRKQAPEADRILAAAPRSDRLLFCSLSDRSLASARVAEAWRLHEADDETGVPLTPRLFVVSRPGDVRFLDVGLGPDRLGDWTPHRFGPAVFRAPPAWRVGRQGDQWVLWPGGDGPRIRIRTATAGAGSPYAASQLAQRVRARHGMETEVGYGYFNGHPWAWVDTGIHQGFATASMFVVFPECTVVLQTEVPENLDPQDAATVQKIIASVERVKADGQAP